MMGFGQHLMLDGYGGNREKLADLDLIYSFLDTYPKAMKMTKIMPPYVFKYSGRKPEDWGLSGVVLIAESHISIHTFPDKEFLSLDMFSCKMFNTERAIYHVKKLFEVKKAEISLLDRGLEFPKDIMKAKEIVFKERLSMAG
ncbi:MAG: S-adenosylmethionine decarboxylase [Candidatus Tectomicrobia bacterium]|uniref:S-adenosylmethionine decarboxylase n=1 Tax=Tectimicrobiota bacterium TaxID=2528274 RepID=A0A932GPV3_UNCTE|nr:S-adenosylmethionine decarboxylase [Candidatus Tectomicrobia bacterium]